MPTINIEMMQKLLQEFTEKEALTGEEIKVIEQQVLDLEARIGACRDRLQNLNEDKDRLASMMSRYVGAGHSPGLPLRASSSRPRTTHSKLPDHSQVMPTKSTPVPAAESTASAPAKDSVIEDLEPENKENTSQNEVEDKDTAGGGDDAIKSINDALKGLFRK